MHAVPKKITKERLLDLKTRLINSCRSITTAQTATAKEKKETRRATYDREMLTIQAYA